MYGKKNKHNAEMKEKFILLLKTLEESDNKITKLQQNYKQTMNNIYDSFLCQHLNALRKMATKLNLDTREAFSQQSDNPDALLSSIQ
jgi:hypothetical protein